MHVNVEQMHVHWFPMLSCIQGTVQAVLRVVGRRVEPVLQIRASSVRQVFDSRNHESQDTYPLIALQIRNDTGTGSAM